MGACRYFSLAKSCPTACNPMDCSMPGSAVFHFLPRVCPDSCPLSWWCYLSISSSVAPFSGLQSFPASGSFPVSWLFASDDQCSGASASASVLHYFWEFAQSYVHWIGDAIQNHLILCCPLLLLPSILLSQHQDLFQWVSSSHQITKVLELQHQSFQRIFRVDFL